MTIEHDDNDGRELIDGRSMRSDGNRTRWPLLLRADEIADLLGVTRAWIYEQSRAGRIPHVKLGRYYRYRLDAIEEWMRGLERASVEPRVKQTRGGR